MSFNPQIFKKILERKVVVAGAVVFNEGDRANSAYIILRGKVQISNRNSDGDQVLLTEIGEGEMFGELALMTPDSARSATAISKDGCELAVISQSKLRERLDEADPLIRYWIKSLADRVLDLSKRVKGPITSTKSENT